MAVPSNKSSSIDLSPSGRLTIYNQEKFLFTLFVIAASLFLSSCWPEPDIFYYDINTIGVDSYNSSSFWTINPNESVVYNHCSLLLSSKSRGLTVTSKTYTPPSRKAFQSPDCSGDMPTLKRLTTVANIKITASWDFKPDFEAGKLLNLLFKPVWLDKYLLTLYHYPDGPTYHLEHYIDQYHEITDYYNASYNFAYAYQLIEAPLQPVSLKFYLQFEFSDGRKLMDSTELVIVMPQW